MRFWLVSALLKGFFGGVSDTVLSQMREVLKKAQDLDNTEHSMFPFIEKFRSLKEAVAKFGRI